MQTIKDIVCFISLSPGPPVYKGGLWLWLTWVSSSKQWRLLDELAKLSHWTCLVEKQAWLWWFLKGGVVGSQRPLFNTTTGKNWERAIVMQPLSGWWLISSAGEKTIQEAWSHILGQLACSVSQNIPFITNLPHHMYMGLSKGETDTGKRARACGWINAYLSLLLEETNQRAYPGDGGPGQLWVTNWNNCILESISNSEIKDYKF